MNYHCDSMDAQKRGEQSVREDDMLKVMENLIVSMRMLIRS